MINACCLEGKMETRHRFSTLGGKVPDITVSPLLEGGCVTNFPSLRLFESQEANIGP